VATEVVLFAAHLCPSDDPATGDCIGAVILLSSTSMAKAWETLAEAAVIQPEPGGRSRQVS
jgi:hypothetical protein